MTSSARRTTLLGHQTGLGCGPPPPQGPALRMILAINQGINQHDMSRRRRPAPRVRAQAAAEFPAVLPATAGLGSSTIPRGCRMPCSARPLGQCGPPGSFSRSSAAVGITMQRETTILWEPDVRASCGAHDGVSQNRRTAERLSERCQPSCAGAGQAWSPTPTSPPPNSNGLLAPHKPAAPRAQLSGPSTRGSVWKLIIGRLHTTNVTERIPDNAPRPRHPGLGWRLLELFGTSIPVLLPRLVRSSKIIEQDQAFGFTLPIAGITDNQPTALFRHSFFVYGQTKAAYGTSSFMLTNISGERSQPRWGSSRRRLPRWGARFEGTIVGERRHDPVAARRPRRLPRRRETRTSGSLGGSTDGILVRCPSLRRTELAALLEYEGARTDIRISTQHDPGGSLTPRSR